MRCPVAVPQAQLDRGFASQNLRTEHQRRNSCLSALRDVIYISGKQWNGFRPLLLQVSQYHRNCLVCSQDKSIANPSLLAWLSRIYRVPRCSKGTLQISVSHLYHRNKFDIRVCFKSSGTTPHQIIQRLSSLMLRRRGSSDDATKHQL